MKQLLVVDQVKRIIHANTRAYVELELNETKWWLKSQEVAELAVEYERTYSVERVTQGPVAKEGRSGEGKSRSKSLNTGVVLCGSGGRKCFF